MKKLLFIPLVFVVHVLWAQQLQLKVPSKQLPPIKQATPLPMFRYSSDSTVAYSRVDNMPVLIAQSGDAMPNAMPITPQGEESKYRYRMPNPLKKNVLPQKRK